MIFRQFGDLRRVDKRIARKLYNEGKDVMFCPCNMRPDHTFGMGILENKDWLGNEGKSFDEVSDWYTWYNCNSETGRYVAYYMVEEK